jgi:hypothetical protein
MPTEYDYERECKKIDETVIYSPCCFNSLAKSVGLNKFQCVKCRRIWEIKEK